MAKIEKLIEGYRRFYKKYFKSNDTLYKTLKDGQSPKTLIIACSDSRVDPSIISDADPGDIFVIRNVANLVPPYEPHDDGLHGVSAALEFAVRVLQVENIVILGHSKCAGVHTLLHPETLETSDFIGKWVSVGEEAKAKAHQKVSNDKESLNPTCEKEVILLSLKNLMTFPWIKEKTDAGALTLHGWYFPIDNGCLQQYNPSTEAFEPLCS
jgi:carbonic anhydrase